MRGKIRGHIPVLISIDIDFFRYTELTADEYRSMARHQRFIPFGYPTGYKKTKPKGEIYFWSGGQFSPFIKSQHLHVPAFPVPFCLLHFLHSASEDDSSQFHFPQFTSSPACCFLPCLLIFTCTCSPVPNSLVITLVFITSCLVVCWIVSWFSRHLFPHVSTSLEFACFLNSAIVSSPLIFCL